MKANQNHSKQIAAYLSGQLNSLEKAAIDEWVKASAENERIFQESSLVWKNSGVKLKAVDETEEQWKKLQLKLDQKQGKVISIFSFNNVLKIAATFLLLAGVTYAFIKFTQYQNLPIELGHSNNLVTTSSGEKVMLIHLPDSTAVWLNVNSTISYSKNFQHNRQATLEGEGYFEVTHDERNPFTVNTKNAVLRVIGTAFNVKVDHDKTYLTVIHGSVQITPNFKDAKQLDVKAHEKASCDLQGNLEKSKSTDGNFKEWLLSNNEIYEKEIASPIAYLSPKYSSRKNLLHQSVIEGTLTNEARFAGYKNILLKISYTKANGVKVNVNLKVKNIVKAGETIRFQKRLMDILSNTRSFEVQVSSAESTKPVLKY